MGIRFINESRFTLYCLTGVLVCLLAVGVESNTFIRHVFQVIPIVLVLIFGLLRSRWTRSGALGVFVCWLFIMTLIWLYLAGIQTLFTGNFTGFEIVLTIVIGGLSVFGIFITARSEAGVRWPAHAAVSVVYALFQLFVIWLSPLSQRISAVW